MLMAFYTLFPAEMILNIYPLTHWKNQRGGVRERGIAIERGGGDFPHGFNLSVFEVIMYL